MLYARNIVVFVEANPKPVFSNVPVLPDRSYICLILPIALALGYIRIKVPAWLLLVSEALIDAFTCANFHGLTIYART